MLTEHKGERMENTETSTISDIEQKRLSFATWQVNQLFGAMESLDADKIKWISENLAKTLNILPPQLTKKGFKQ